MLYADKLILNYSSPMGEGAAQRQEKYATGVKSRLNVWTLLLDSQA